MPKGSSVQPTTGGNVRDPSTPHSTDLESGPKQPEKRFKLSTNKILTHIQSVHVSFFGALAVAVAASVFPDVVPVWVTAVYSVLHCLYVTKFMFWLLTTFSDSWAQEFQAVEMQRDNALEQIFSLKIEIMEKSRENDADVKRMRDSIGETKQHLEEQILDQDEVMEKVKKLDQKMSAAAELRQSKSLLNRILTGSGQHESKFIAVSELMEMIKRLSICSCTLTEEQQRSIKIRTDATALRLICHNFTTFSRNNEDTNSNYKAFATLDMKVPSNLGPNEKKVTTVEVKVKYNGKPLDDKELAKMNDLVVKLESRRTLTLENDGLKGSSETKSGMLKVSPTTSFNNKLVWQNMVEGKNLVVAYHIASMLGGKITVDREFSFSTISFVTEVHCMPNEEATTPDAEPKSKRKARYSPHSTPPSIPREIKLSNNIDDIVNQLPKMLKIVTVSDDVSTGEDLIKNLKADPLSSTALKLDPQNVDILPDVCMGLVEVDKKDDRIVRRLTSLEAMQADIVVVCENLGQDSKGRRWLGTSMAIKLEQLAFKGTVCLWVEKYDKKRIKSLAAARFIHAVLCKGDDLKRMRAAIVFGMARDKTIDQKFSGSTGTFKRNNSFQREDKDKAKDPVVVAHRLSERKRRHSDEALPAMRLKNSTTP